jgi:hypothetical protein
MIQFVPHRKYFSTTNTNRLMLPGETIAVYRGNHMEQTHSKDKLQSSSLFEQMTYVINTGLEKVNCAPLKIQEYYRNKRV